MEGGCHVSQLELHGLKAAYGLPKLLAHGRMFLSCVQAESCSAQAAGPYVDAAAVHCGDTPDFRTLARHCQVLTCIKSTQGFGTVHNQAQGKQGAQCIGEGLLETWRVQTSPATSAPANFELFF